MEVLIGIDPHKATNVVAAIDEQGEVVGEEIFPANRKERVIRRTAPALLGLLSLVTLFADQQKARMPETVQQAAWYDKEHPTFSDVLAVVRKELWTQEATFCGSPQQDDTVKVLREFVERLTDALCYAA